MAVIYFIWMLWICVCVLFSWNTILFALAKVHWVIAKTATASINLNLSHLHSYPSWSANTAIEIIDHYGRAGYIVRMRVLKQQICHNIRHFRFVLTSWHETKYFPKTMKKSCRQEYLQHECMYYRGWSRTIKKLYVAFHLYLQWTQNVCVCLYGRYRVCTNETTINDENKNGIEAIQNELFV